ncbi:hypothetical protein V1Y59_07515 [Gordonia sp. PKS22-38]|uniref:Uridine kinase n=1 Tax=Gordonia prachuapensis TaxID=3115651 RepID=A0ABU7MRH9_9ACTN|nr:hypothetical protein [Gordonia sp. PKS22-38]
MPTFSPITPDGLVELGAELATRRPQRRVVLLVDGPDAAAPTDLADRIAERLTTLGRPAAVVSSADYLRPASLRLEYGHTDTESYRTIWFDFDAMRREVIDTLRDRGQWLPRLWDPRRDRSFRDRPREAAPDQVLLVAGPMLLGSGLHADATLALRLTAGALHRRTPDDQSWTIPALLDHDRDAPAPDVEVRYDHPDRPAVRAVLQR